MKNSLVETPSVAITLMTILLLAALALAGCNKGDSSEQARDASSEGADGGEAADSGDDSGPIDPSMFNQIKQMMVQQATLPATQAETLRQMLAEHPDDQLRKLLAELDAKNASIKAMLDKITSPADSKALQVDVPKAIGEAGELVAKANDRLQEVLRAKTGLGAGGGGR
jgi:hypothetical protein